MADTMKDQKYNQSWQEVSIFNLTLNETQNLWHIGFGPYTNIKANSPVTAGLLCTCIVSSSALQACTSTWNPYVNQPFDGNPDGHPAWVRKLIFSPALLRLRSLRLGLSDVYVPCRQCSNNCRQEACMPEYKGDTGPLFKTSRGWKINGAIQAMNWREKFTNNTRDYRR